MNAGRLISLICLVGCVAGCEQHAPPMRVTGNLSPNDVAEILRVVHKEMITRFHSANNRRPIKSIEVTTNSLYEIDRGRVSRLTSEAATNRSVENMLHEKQKELESERPRPAVEVWYEDKHARWGAAGFLVEKHTNEWKVTVELFQ